jgi:hypothetical protein
MSTQSPAIYMSLFNFFKKTNPASVPTEMPNLPYELLFCDNLEIYHDIFRNKNLPSWDALFSAYYPGQLREIINNPVIESRAKLLAYRQLAEFKDQFIMPDLLGVIVEIGFEEGVDVLAVYLDGTARYINQSGRLFIWETSDQQSEELTRAVFSGASKILDKIGPWEKPRLNPPKSGNARITLLASHQLYFGEAESDTLFNDPLASPAMRAATKLLIYITSKLS